MCGILFTNKNIENVNLDHVLEFLKKRGPDSYNVKYINDCTFIHTLLSMTGPPTEQPFYNETNDVICIFNGEIYNFEDFGNYLSDGECLIPLYEQYGDDFISKLDGEFSLLLVDFKQNKLIVSTDIFGTRPLWMGFNDKTFGISSYKSCLDRINLTNNFQVLANTTYIFDLTHIMLKTEKCVHTFDLTQHKTSFDDWNQAFTESIKKRTRYAKCGIFIGMSGGYDSGAIACELTKQNVEFTAYSIANVEDKEVMQQRERIVRDAVIFDIKRDEFLGARQFLKQNAEEYKLNIDNGEKDKYFALIENPNYNKGSAQKLLDIIEFRKNGQLLTDDNGAIGCSYICSLAKKRGQKIYLSGSGADEIFSDYGFNKIKYFDHSTIGGYFPDDLATVFPWKNFFGNTQRAYLMKEEHVAGAYGIEGRYPFLDKYVVQEFLWLTAELKNKNYKSPLDNYLVTNNFPFEKNQKTGFGCGHAGPSGSSKEYEELSADTIQKARSRKVIDVVTSRIVNFDNFEKKTYEHHDAIDKSTIRHVKNNLYSCRISINEGGAKYFGKCNYFLLENNKKIGFPENNHSKIAEKGSGLHCFWTPRMLYFSTGDNTDPRNNERIYTINKLQIDTNNNQQFNKSIKQQPYKKKITNDDLRRKQLKSNILVVSADLPYIGGCGTNSYKIIDSLRKIQRYNIIGLFITNIDGKHNPDNFDNIYRINISLNIENELLFFKENINKIYGSIDVIIIKNYKSFVFIDRVFPDEKKLFISSGLRYFTNKIMQLNTTTTELLDKKFNALDFVFDENILQYGNIYENVLKNDLHLEKYVYNRATTIVSNSELTAQILTNANVRDITIINTTFIDYHIYPSINFIDRQYDLIFVAYDLSRRIKNYKLMVDLINTGKLDDKKILFVGKFENATKINNPNIKYFGYLDNNEIITLLQNTKTLICPSLYDSNPNVILEAMECECNVITSHNVGNWKLINSNMVINDFYNNNEWIDKIILSTSKQFTNNFITSGNSECNVTANNIVTELIIQIDKLLFNNTLNVIFNCSRKCNSFFFDYNRTHYKESLGNNIESGCYVHHDKYNKKCPQCSYIMCVNCKYIDYYELEKELVDIEFDNKINFKRNIYFDICLEIAKQKGYDKVNYISYDGAAGYEENYKNSKYFTTNIDNVSVNIFCLNDPKDIIRFRHGNLTFLRGFYGHVHCMFKMTTIFYSATCLEIAENNNKKNQTIYPNYTKILYHTLHEKIYYERKMFSSKNLIQFNKFNDIDNMIIKNNRKYDIGFIASGNGTTKNISLFTNFLDYIILNDVSIQIIIICNNEIFKKYENFTNIYLLYSSEFSKTIHLNEIYNDTKIVLTLSIYDYNPRVISESLSYGCYNILFKQIYSGSYIIEENNTLGYLIDLDMYDLGSINIVEVEKKYYPFFSKIWTSIIDITMRNIFDHIQISKIFNNKFSKYLETNKILTNLHKL